MQNDFYCHFYCGLELAIFFNPKPLYQDVINRLIFSSLFGLWSVVSVMAQTEDHFLGFFAHDPSGLTIHIALAQPGAYKLNISFQGNSYPGEAVKLLGLLNGTYTFQGHPVAFSISRLLGQYYFTSEGVDVPLEKRQAPSASTQTSPPISPQVTTSTGERASGPLIKDTESGYALNIPSGWKATKSGDGSYQVTLNEQQSKVISVATHAYNDLETFIQESSQPNSEINLISPIEKFGMHGALASYRGRSAKGESYTFQAIGLMSPHGGGIIVGVFEMGASTPSEKLMGNIQSMANTVQWSKPIVSAAAQAWAPKLKGKQLLYLFTGNGLSEKWSYDLCSDGKYIYHSNSSYLSGNFNESFSAAGQDSNRGTWKLVSRQGQAVLVLSNQQGGVQEFTLTTRTASNEVGLNGKRYFVQASESCR